MCTVSSAWYQVSVRRCKCRDLCSDVSGSERLSWSFLLTSHTVPRSFWRHPLPDCVAVTLGVQRPDRLRRCPGISTQLGHITTVCLTLDHSAGQPGVWCFLANSNGVRTSVIFKCHYRYFQISQSQVIEYTVEPSFLSEKLISEHAH